MIVLKKSQGQLLGAGLVPRLLSVGSGIPPNQMIENSFHHVLFSDGT